MRSGRRFIVVALEIATFVAFVLLVIVWITSFETPQSFGHEKRMSSSGGWDYTFVGVSAFEGVVAVGKMREVGSGMAASVTVSRSRWIAGPNTSLWWEFDRRRTFASFGADYIYKRPIGLVRTGWLVTSPMWFALLLTLWPVAMWSGVFVGRVRARRRMARGKCAGCGYDLRGIDTDRCPECGRSRNLQP